jgi:hypothetical protein
LGSSIDNYLLVANPTKGLGHGTSIVGPCNSTGMIDQYLTMSRITAYGYADIPATDGSIAQGCAEDRQSHIHITWANSKLDQLVSGSGNSVSAAGDFPAPWTSMNDLVTAMGAGSLENLYNMMVSRPDLPWARAMVTAAFTAHGKGQPLSGVPPPTPFTPDLTPYYVDNTAPTLSSPAGTGTGSTTANISAATNENNGRLFSVVTDTSTQPAAHFVIRGLDATGQPVGGGGSHAIFAGSQLVTSTGSKTIGATGLSAGPSYYAHFVHEDANGNISSIASSSAFTTSTPTTWAPATNWTLSGGNLTATSGSSADIIFGSQAKTSGTFAVTITTNGGGNRIIGVADNTSSSSGFVGQDTHSVGYQANAGNIIYNSGVLASVATAGLPLT